MHIETYTDQYYLDVVKIAQNFHTESIKEYDDAFDPDAVIDMILKLKDNQAENAFLLIIDGRCQGMLAGIEAPSLINKKRIFQELIWYVNEPFRRYGVVMLNKVREILKERGFETMVMAVLENSKTEKIKRLYESMGFRPFEVHYIGAL